MFDDILGRDEEVFYEGDDNPIEFEYEGESRPLSEKMREFIEEYFKDNFDGYDEPGLEDEDYCYENCDECKPKDLLHCRFCGREVKTPKAVHHDCYKKLVEIGKWKHCYWR